jgi:mannuronan 5-epimerase
MNRIIFRYPVEKILFFLASILIIAFLIISVCSQLLITSLQSVYSIRTISTSPAQSQPVSCIVYDIVTRVITVSCTSASLTDIYNQLHNTDILSKQPATTASEGTAWLLKASLVISKGSTFYVNTTDTKWLKISSEHASPTSSINAASSPLPYHIDVHGSLSIDNVKITSWDPTTNNYAITNGSREAVAPGTKGATANGYIIHFGAPRPFIKVEHDTTGTTNITNSEIAYLGYESGISNIGSAGLNYYGGNGSSISGNRIHDLYFGFYSSGVSNLVLQGNDVYNNADYGLDPHTGTHDTVIRYNVVHDNGAHGIICSLNCYNVLIENNRLYHNGNAGIMFSRNMSNSIARNNIISNEVNGILISQSSNNKIYNNTISNSQTGISLTFGSSGNTFYSNVIKNSSRYGIYSQVASNNNNNSNIFYNNHLINSGFSIGGSHNNSKQDGEITKGSVSKAHKHRTLQ